MPFDIPEESIFILIFLLISFLNWIGEKVKKAKQASAQRRPPVRGYEEEPPDFPTSPAPTSQVPPQPSQREEDPMRQILESLGIPTETPSDTPPPVPHSSPPPLEAQASPPLWEAQESFESESQADRDDENPWALEQLTEEERLAMEKLAGTPSVTRRRKHHRTSKEIRQLLTGGRAKTAFVLKEVLDKPKCFDTLPP